jgi:hypothetical protein
MNGNDTIIYSELRRVQSMFIEADITKEIKKFEARKKLPILVMICPPSFII